MVKKIILGVIIVFILIQFIQPSHNNGAAEATTDITHVVRVPDNVLLVLKVSCYDCHSNHTNYPWYSKISPVNWWLNSHIKEGKRKLNFSEISTYNFKKRGRKLEEAAELIEKDEMPVHSYLWIHKDAQLDEVKKKMLIDWANSARKEVLQDSLSHSKAM
jgi:Haem-binding domain